MSAIVKKSDIVLDKPETFIRKKLTPEQAKQRLKILEVQQEALEEIKSDLSPRSSRELKEIANVLAKEEILFSERITRKEPSQFYDIEFNKHPRDLVIEKFKNRSRKIDCMLSSIPEASGLAIIQAIVKPSEEMTWYQTATLMQMESILKTDFLDGLKHHYAANLNLLSAARSLAHHSDVFEKITKLHSESFHIYEAQSNFNRNCEVVILDHSKTTQKSLEDMRSLMLECGPTLEDCPENFLERGERIITIEVAQAMNLYQNIEKFSEDFLKMLEPLKTGIDECIKTITLSNNKVIGVMQSLDDVLKQKEDLAKREEAIQFKFDAFQAARMKEHASKKEVRTGGNKIKILGIPIYSSGLELRIVEADFGSRSLFEEYNSSKREAKEIERKIKRLESSLDIAIAGSKEDLPQASSSLSAALLAVKQLENAIAIKRSKAKTQVELIQGRLEDKKFDFKDIKDALIYLDIFRDKTLYGHTIWVQSHKQSGTISRIRDEETHLMNLLMEDLREGKDEGKFAIQEIIKSLFSSNEGISSKMLKNEELLEEQLLLTE